jgi:acylphosphatase
MTDTQTMQLHAVVQGHVQGVGFRAFVLATAQHENLTGWVRNCYNGNVELLAEGDRTSLETLLDAIRRGPSGSYVSHVEYQWQEAGGKFIRFSVAPTE